jgi:hypothetical protein
LPFAAAQVGLDERVLGCEMLVQGARRYVGFLCERRDSGRINPLLIEQPIRGLQDPFARAATADRRSIPVHNIKYSERFTLPAPACYGSAK